MKTMLALLAAPFLSLVTPNATAAPPNMQPGMWEITTKTEMPGMPMQTPPMTMRQCYKNENMKEAKDALPADKNCKLDDFKQNGNTVRWKVSCKMEGAPMVGVGEITYAGQSYAGTMTMKGNVEGMDVNMTNKYSAKRIGDCK